ncbi:hypothetical protein SDC9_183981 [bioreactor metagenome]|uniref:Lipoprotein n=1 Tax=bioreactor metagenome TaxID=1076179 RepID=A0A645HDN2_9ZZZZ
MKMSFKSKYTKILIGCITIYLGIFMISSCGNRSNKLPNNIPNVNIIVNGDKYNTIKGEGTWFDKEMGGGNSFIGPINEKFNEISFIEVNSNEKLSFDISYLDNIQETTLYNIEFSEVVSGKRIKITNDIYEFNVPQEKGEYYYSFNIEWDDTHNFEYLFKIKVK